MRPKDLLSAEPIIRPRMPELDAIRGIAILMVVLFHGFGGIAWLPVARPLWQRVFLNATKQGWVGVNLFFVLSGFLITGILLDSVGKPGYYARFYSHRALRILPAYYLMLLVLLVGNYIMDASPHETLAFVGVSFIYLSNLAPMFGVSIIYPLLWSLSVEEHFYLLWPTVVRLLTKRGVAIVALLVCVIEPALRLYAMAAGTDLWWSGGHRGGTFSYTWMTVDGLALGALLGVLARSAWGKRRNFLNLALMVAAVSVLATGVSFIVPDTLAVCLRDTLVNYYALALIAGALWLGTGVHRGWVNIRVLSFYGYISYGLYLVHGWMFGMYFILLGKLAPALLPGSAFGRTCAEFVICAAAATTVAYFSRVTYEQFFLSMKDKVPKTRDTEGAIAAA